MTLRSLVQSERFEQGWHLIAQCYRASIGTPDNVLILPLPRAH